MKRPGSGEPAETPARLTRVEGPKSALRAGVHPHTHDGDSDSHSHSHSHSHPHSHSHSHRHCLMPKHGPNVWVVCSGGRFTIKEEGNRRALIEPASQRTAIGIARKLAKANRSELIIQGKRGRIRARDSHGFDSFPPRG